MSRWNLEIVRLIQDKLLPGELPSLYHQEQYR